QSGGLILREAAGWSGLGWAVLGWAGLGWAGLGAARRMLGFLIEERVDRGACIELGVARGQTGLTSTDFFDVHRWLGTPGRVVSCRVVSPGPAGRTGCTFLRFLLATHNKRSIIRPRTR
ncbi:MAG: hypothetical protein V3V08_17830, partial [Nannocystaceae bacterium]